MAVRGTKVSAAGGVIRRKRRPGVYRFRFQSIRQPRGEPSLAVGIQVV